MTSKQAQVNPSSHEGMGGTLHDGRVSFRVWAPHADAVYVVGTFNDWSKTAHPLAREEGGVWSADVAEAEVDDEYQYRIVNGDLELRRNDPYARALTSSAGTTIIVDPDFDWGDDRFEMPRWNDLIIYELHVGTFNDEPGGGPGSFQGVIEKLPYLKDLGVNALQIMPPLEFPGGFSWGYNPAYIFAVESEYGGARAFKELIKAAHEKGLAVLLDVVYNHFGPDDLDLWRFDGWSEDDGGGIYFYNDWRAKTPWGETRPHYERGEVQRYLLDNVMMWLHEFRIDGLRWDATAYIRNVEGNDNPDTNLPEGWSLMQEINDEIDDDQPWKISTAEDSGSNPWIVRETAEDGAGFDAQWDTHFVDTIREAIIKPDDAARDAHEVARALERRYNNDVFERIVYTESHDDVASGRARVPEEISPEDSDSWYAKKRSALGAALVFTAPGVPLIFQGQEFLEDGWFQDQDPLEWERVERFRGLHDLYQDLIRLRRNLDGISAGLQGQEIDVYHLNQADKVLAFHRWKETGPGDSVVVVINLANRSHDRYLVGFPRGGTWRLRFNSDWDGYDPDFSDCQSFDVATEETERDGLPHRGSFSIGPYTALIFSQDPEPAA